MLSCQFRSQTGVLPFFGGWVLNKFFKSPSLIPEGSVDQCFCALGAQDGELMWKLDKIKFSQIAIPAHPLKCMCL